MEFGVARAGGGYATVVIKKPYGHTRAIFFRMGKPVGADTSEAGGYPKFSATRTHLKINVDVHGKAQSG